MRAEYQAPTLSNTRCRNVYKCPHTGEKRKQCLTRFSCSGGERISSDTKIKAKVRAVFAARLSPEAQSRWRLSCDTAFSALIALWISFFTRAKSKAQWKMDDQKASRSTIAPGAKYDPVQGFFTRDIGLINLSEFVLILTRSIDVSWPTPLWCHELHSKWQPSSNPEKYLSFLHWLRAHAYKLLCGFVKLTEKGLRVWWCYIFERLTSIFKIRNATMDNQDKRESKNI